MQMNIALVGNKNSGKTTIFNKLTGLNEHVGNFPGVTTQKVSGVVKEEYAYIKKNNKNITQLLLSDLPGIYSLRAYSAEEEETIDYITKKNKPNVILNVVDATNLERNLYLTLQLMQLDIPMVIGLNMVDDLYNSGITIDIEKLARSLGVPVVPISTNKDEGIGELVKIALDVFLGEKRKVNFDFCTDELHRAIHSIAHIVEDHAQEKGYATRYVATAIVAGDDEIIKSLGISENDYHIIEHIVENMEFEIGMDSAAALADMSYNYVEKLCNECVSKKSLTKEQIRSDKIDVYLTHRVFGIPIFLGVMALIFWLTFSVIGGPLQEVLKQLFDYGSMRFGNWMLAKGISYWLYDLTVNGIMAGVFSVLSFLPIIMVLFFCLSLLEDSGYMTRVSFVMDKLLRKIGLSGRSFAPLIVGFGCNVPAILSTRTLPSEHDRKLTILLIPFMSCSAKLPVYGMMTAAFFGAKGTLVMVSLYFIGILVATLVGFILSRTVYKGDCMMYIMELPTYRLPELSTVLSHMWEKASEFVKKAFTVIFLATIIIWFLQNFDCSFNAVSDSGDSILAFLGGKIAFIFAPLGFGNWQASTALIAGITAKEAVVSTLTVLMGSGNEAMLSSELMQIFSPLSAYSFLVFVLLYIPCVATFAASRKELNSTALALVAVCMQIVVAYCVAFLIYTVGSLFV